MPITGRICIDATVNPSAEERYNAPDFPQSYEEWMAPEYCRIRARAITEPMIVYDVESLPDGEQRSHPPYLLAPDGSVTALMAS
jgi:hypothetical protein